MEFTHLHLHTEYSLLDGACRIGPLIDAAKALGQKSIAVTDHGVMYGVIDFYKAAKKRGIKPIIGCEVYVAARSRFDRQHSLDSESNHLVLLCENNTGYQNLMKLVSLSFTEGFYSRPRVDKALLEKYHEGIIALSACLAGQIPRALLRDDYDEAKRIAIWYREVFGENNFFIEVQDHGIPEQQRINPHLKRLAQETGIGLVATNDVHYIEKEDARIQQVLMCIATNTTMLDDQKLELATKEFYLKSSEEMARLFSSFDDAVLNTAKIAERCNVEIEFGNTKLPRFEIGDRDHAEYMREICLKAIPLKYGENPDAQVIQRFEYEMQIITQMGYVDYFLIVYDFVRFAKSRGIPVGPGRGSGAGSLCAYLMGITGMDPIKYQLFFERFLNPERVSMPDFDIDFCYVRRQEVIDYVVEKYGADHVAQIVTFGTLAARAAIRDVGRALGVPYAICDQTAKLVPMALGITVQGALAKSKELKDKYESDLQIKDLIDTALKVEGMPRHASTHAAGVVITDKPVSSYVPLARNDEAIVAQFTMTTLEELGLLKMDFLGLRFLTVVYDAEKLVRQKNPEFSVDNLPLDDKAVYEMMSAGNTTGIFQFESGGMRSVLMRLKPVDLEDLIAVISLFRPGPMESIPKYIENRHNPKKVTYRHPLLEPILKVTYGCLVYQEQVMQVFRELGGYSLGRADIVRRAMSKKKHDVMEKERKAFIYGDETAKGAVAKGVPAETANKIFDEMSSFASYAFNKSHAAAYAYLSYQTAYLKAHYPQEYFAALLTSVMHSTGKVSEYIAECERLAIKILPPNIEKSQKFFTVEDDAIRFSLLAIKNLGEGVIDNIIKERENGAFSSLYEFCDRLYGRDLNKRALESLIKSGAADGFSGNRRQNYIAVESILDVLREEHKYKDTGQLGLFDAPDMQREFALPHSDDYSLTEKLAMEKEITGLYLSGHPLEEYRELIRSQKTAKTTELAEAGQESAKYRDNDRVSVIGIISEIRLKPTKNNSTMAYLTLEDFYSEIEVILFPKTLSENRHLAIAGEIVRIEGRVSVREDRDAQLICERILRVNDKSPMPPHKTAVSKQKSSVKEGLYLRCESMECPEIKQALKMTAIFEGNVPLYIVTSSDGKKHMAGRALWVDPNEPMIRALKNVLGEENVKLVLP